MKRIDLLPKVKEVGINSIALYSDLMDFVLSSEKGGEDKINCDSLKVTLQTFVSRLREKFTKHNRKFQRLIEKEKDWLETDIKIERISPPSVSVVGRPRKSWEETSDRTKRQRVASLADNEPQVLALAAAQSVRQNSKADHAIAIKKSFASEENLVKAKQGIQKQEPVQMVPETALALKVHCNLSDDQYQMIKNASKTQFADIYPSLHKIFDVKQKCYPEDL